VSLDGCTRVVFSACLLVCWSLLGRLGQYADLLDMQRFLPPVSPTKMNLLEPWKDMADDIIEIPDGAGLSDHTRSDLVELWTSGDDSGFHDPYSPVRILLQYQLQSRRFSLAIHSLGCRPSYWGT
jgi:hypothetical protein